MDKHVSFKQKEGGILNPIISLGVTALRFGFNAKYIGYNPIIANDNSSENLKASLEKKSKKYFDYGKFNVDKAIDFLELGGKIEIDKLNIDKLKIIIDLNKFALVVIKPAFISKTGSVSMNHKVIIAGYNSKGFKILNPFNAKEELVNFDDFLLAFYAATPELLIIEPKKV